MSTADANYRGLRSVSCRHPGISQQEKRTCLEALPATAGALIFARRGMLTGLAASRLQDVWKSICEGVVGVVVGSMRPGYAVIRCRMDGMEDLGYATGEVQQVIIIDRPICRGKTRRQLKEVIVDRYVWECCNQCGCN